MKTYITEVVQIVNVTLDETKFTDEWLSEFRSYMYPFDSIEEHVQHLAQLHARGIADNWSFIEGYGRAEDMGIKFEIVDTEVELLAEDGSYAHEGEPE